MCVIFETKEAATFFFSLKKKNVRGGIRIKTKLHTKIVETFSSPFCVCVNDGPPKILKYFFLLRNINQPSKEREQKMEHYKH